jgi:hypothetical protein
MIQIREGKILGTLINTERTLDGNYNITVRHNGVTGHYSTAELINGCERSLKTIATLREMHERNGTVDEWDKIPGKDENVTRLFEKYKVFTGLHLSLQTGGGAGNFFNDEESS